MTLVVENGTGLANADALISVDYFLAYQLARSDSAPEATTAEIEAAIRRASFFLSNSYSWKGYLLKGRAQALAWPRSGVADEQGWFVPADAVPREVLQATAEVALRELVSPGAMTPDVTLADRVKSEQIGAIAVEYALTDTSAEASRPVLLIVRDLIGGLLEAGSGNPLVGESYRR